MFVSFAENMGVIEEMGRIVIEKSFQFLRSCHERGSLISLSVNVSLRQLLRSDFADELADLAEHFSLDPEWITLELTESQALLGVHSESATLERLSETGFHLAIDDFGKGHSALASLHEMPVEEIKIDMQFVHNLHTEKGRKIVQTIEELSRFLGLTTIAEGVETKEQKATLQRIGITKLQGYLFAKPMPGEELFEYLDRTGITPIHPRRALSQPDAELYA